MIRKKYITLPFLLLAWAIIFAHSIIPHHHHLEIAQECNDCHSHGISLSEILEFHNCSDDCHDDVCHFNIQILTQVSIDIIFIVNNDNIFLKYFIGLKEECTNYNEGFVSNQIPKTDHLRGPPIIS